MFYRSFTELLSGGFLGMEKIEWLYGIFFHGSRPGSGSFPVMDALVLERSCETVTKPEKGNRVKNFHMSICVCALQSK